MTNPTCPKCSKPMVKRFRRSDNQAFWGCSQFPNCRGTRNIDTQVVSQPVQQPTAYSKYTLNGKPFTPSDRQAALLDFTVKNTGNLFANAFAGTGKSTTAAFIINQLPRSKQVIYFAFNKAIAKEFAEKYGLNASTMHSFGYRCLTQALGKLTVDGQKKTKLARKYFPLNKTIRKFVTRVASLAMNTGFDYTNPSVLQDMIYHYDLEMDDSILQAKDDNGQLIPLESILQAVGAIVIDSLEMIETDKVIDYDDMLFYPVYASLIPAKFDFIFVDEAQDTNSLQIAFLKKAIKKDGRFVFVGDRYQAIYGFRGAMTDAVDTIVNETKCTVLPLDVTYRCPQSHVRELANKIVPDFKAHTNNIEGEIRYITSEASVQEWKQLDEALILCRTNAPLIKQALRLIAVGKRAKVAGRNMAEGLFDLIEKQDAIQVFDLISKLEEYSSKESARLMEKDLESQAEALQDKVGCILAVCEGRNLVTEVIEQIDALFTDNRGGLLFSSVHRAKGMESQDVYILEPSQLPFGRSTSGWKFEQEKNLMYVAFTRSLNRMTFVGGKPNWARLER